MPKPRMSGITLRNKVANLLHKKAADANKGLNDYLLSLMMGPSQLKLLRASQPQSKP